MRLRRSERTKPADSTSPAGPAAAGPSRSTPSEAANNGVQAGPVRSYTVADFAEPKLECDAIMKGGVTSGIVYPYAVLEIARKYRFRSLGGTSAGAIAAAFAAAAEYARSVRNDPDGFLRLQTYCDELPGRLLSLFQPDREFAAAIKLAKRIQKGGLRRWLYGLAARIGIAGLAGAALGWLARPAIGPSWPTIALGVVVAALLALMAILLLTLVLPGVRAANHLVASGFGACSGRTVDQSGPLALTDWLHKAIQHIAFGSDRNPPVLTFGDLQKPGGTIPPIVLRMVTTNLSMGRPHTLPELGIQAGYEPSEWAKLFPSDVMTHLNGKSDGWNKVEGARRVPVGDDLPVICAIRMSLAFPLLFKAIPILTFDHEFKSVVNALGGDATSRLCTAWLSDGGLSSNFPIHLFDSPLPNRPTFAISLDTLQVPPARVKSRVMLPTTPAQGSGVQVTDIRTLTDFGWSVIGAAKDWQDQLASEITGQRERIARVFLDDKEGGLNLAMPEQVSRNLMEYGAVAGDLFTGQFSFDEHRWRRLLGFYQNTGLWIDKSATAWTGGFASWFADYRDHVQSYTDVTIGDRDLIDSEVEALVSASEQRQKIAGSDRKMPGNTGELRVTGRY